MNKVYDIVKDTILDKLQNAIDNNENFEWIKPWHGMKLPINFDTKKPYRGVNLVTLPAGGYYLTFKQVQKLKGKVRKGAKSNPIFFWKFDNEVEREDVDETETTSKKPPIFKYYRVFHQSDIEGIDFGNVNLESEEPILDDNISKFIDTYNNICKINLKAGVNQAYYSPFEDEIVIPTPSEFTSLPMFYSTLFHEITHSTGHKSRLDRLTNAKFGSVSYSKEELVAEVGSCLLKVAFNVNNEDTDKMSIAYLKGWYNYIKDAKGTEITSALQKAQKAYDYLQDKCKCF